MSTYAEALTKAKAISPEAKVRVIGDTQTWEIYIPTDMEIATELSETYKGTPAWRAYEEKDASYGNTLALWGFRRQHYNKPIEYIADYYNLSEREGAAIVIYQNDLNASTGINPDNWSSFSNEDFSQYKKNVEIAHSKVDPSERNALNEKYKDLGN